MARLFTSDWHLGHGRIIELCQRPFGDVHAMNSYIVDAANDKAGSSDELWILGDLAMGDIEQSLTYLDRLNAGKVVLVAGNHDRPSPTYWKGQDKSEHWQDYYIKNSRIDVVYTLPTTVDVNGETFNVSHFPYTAGANPRQRESTFDNYRPIDNGYWLLCGHVHRAWRKHGKTINVGVDAWAGYLVDENDVLELTRTHSPEEHIRPWH